MTRALAALALSALLAGAGLAVLVPRLVDAPSVRTALADVVRERTGASLRMRGIAVGWLPPRLVLEAPSLAPVRDDGAPVLAADAVILRVSALALLRGVPALDAVRHVSVSGEAVRGEGVTGAGGALDLALELNGVPAAALATIVAGLGDDAPEMRVVAGRLGGTLRVSGTARDALHVVADLVLADADLEVEGAAVQGRVGLAFALDAAPGAPWTGGFDADLEGALVEQSLVRKAPGRPTRVTGRLVPQEGGGVVVTDLRVAPLALDLRLGGIPIEIRTGGAKPAADAR